MEAVRLAPRLSVDEVAVGDADEGRGALPEAIPHRADHGHVVLLALENGVPPFVVQQDALGSGAVSSSIRGGSCLRRGGGMPRARMTAVLLAPRERQWASPPAGHRAQHLWLRLSVRALAAAGAVVEPAPAVAVV